VSEWRGSKLDESYHVRVDEHVYSVPHVLVVTGRAIRSRPGRPN